GAGNMNTSIRRRDLLLYAAAAGAACTGHGAAAAAGRSQEGCEGATEQDLAHLRRAIQLSELAATPEYGGNHPFGGVLVLGDGRVVEGWNHSNSENDPGQHAERWLISHAIQSLELDWGGADRPLLSGATLYTSTEPCAMCAGAVYWSGIGRLVFGCS